MENGKKQQTLKKVPAYLKSKNRRPRQNMMFVFTAVPGATYYYKNRTEGTWNKTTDPDSIPVTLMNDWTYSNSSFIYTTNLGVVPELTRTTSNLLEVVLDGNTYNLPLKLYDWDQKEKIDLYYKLDNGSSVKIINDLAVNSQTINVNLPMNFNSLSSGSHTLKVWAVDKTDRKSNEIDYTLNIIKLYPPTLSNTSTTDTTCTLNWNMSPKVTNYEIQRVDTGVIYSTTNLSYTVQGLIPKSAYQFRIRTKYSGFTSSWSNNVNIVTPMSIPAKPAFNNNSFTHDTINLSWNSVEDAEIYEVMETNTGVVKSTSGTNIAFSNMTPSTNYVFKMRAKNTAGYSNWTENYYVTTLNEPKAPTISGINTTDTTCGFMG